jgi:hypothetical protein
MLTITTDIAYVIIAYGYCDPVTFMLKWTSKSHPASVLDVIHIHIKLKR